jgi:hypothetical protein
MSHFRFDILKAFLSIPELQLHDFEGLIFACRYGIYELAAYLLAHWSGPNNPAVDITTGRYCFLNALNDAVKTKDSRLVRLILDHPQTVLENHTLLATSLAFHSTPEIVQMFINYHPLFFQNMDASDFELLLREMIVQESIEIVEQLIKDKILRMSSIIAAAGINNPAILKMILSRPIAFSSEREYVLWDIRTAYSVVRSPEVLKILMSDPRMDPTIDAFDYMSWRLRVYWNSDDLPKYFPSKNEQIKLLQVLFTDPRMDSEIHFRKAYQRGDIDQLRQLIYIRPQLLFYAKESGMLGDGLDETLEVLQQYLIDLETITKVPFAIIAEKVLPFITFPSHTWKIETIHETIFGCLKFY